MALASSRRHRTDPAATQRPIGSIVDQMENALSGAGWRSSAAGPEHRGRPASHAGESQFSARRCEPDAVLTGIE